MLQQIEAHDLRISHLTNEVETLSHSLHEKETTAIQLQKLFQQVMSSPEQLPKIITLATQIAELKQSLQEAEYQKQLLVMEREVAVQDMEVKQKVELQLHKHLGKLQLADMYVHSEATTCIHFYFIS